MFHFLKLLTASRDNDSVIASYLIMLSLERIDNLKVHIISNLKFSLDIFYLIQILRHEISPSFHQGHILFHILTSK